MDYNSLLPILYETWTIKRQQTAKLNDRVPKERLGSSRLPVWPHLKISN